MPTETEVINNKETIINNKLDTLWKEVNSNESIYYCNILIYKSLGAILKKETDSGTLSYENIRNIQDYLIMRVNELQSNNKKEQDYLLNESIRFINKNIKRIRELLMKADEGKAMEVFTELFSKIHSKHYKEFIRITGSEYYPLNDDFFEFKTYKINRYFEVLVKVEKEKQLIHKEILVNQILPNKNFQKFSEILDAGEIEKSIRFIESLVLKNLFKQNSHKVFNRIPNPHKQIFELSYRFQKNQQNLMKGSINFKKAFLGYEQILNEVFQFIEDAFTSSLVYIFTEQEIEQEKAFSKILVKEVKLLISKGQIKKALDKLMDKISEESEVYNQVLILKSRYSKNKEDELLGLETDPKLNVKLANSILQILDTEK